MFTKAASCSPVLGQIESLIATAQDDTILACKGNGWSVHQHLEHLVLSGETILRNIETSLALPVADHRTAGKLSPIGRIVLLTKHIPRGRAKSPDFAVPRDCSAAELRDRLQQLRVRIGKLESCDSEIRACRHLTNHPVLGDFKPAQWIRFLAIHQQHHLDIINDLCGKQ